MADNEIFHVHTWRCGHSSAELDEAYIIKALELGAEKITFTDHAPFPGNPFSNRMDYEQLPEYLFSLQELKKRYAGIIDVVIGLEIEYLPSFHTYYEELRANPNVELLMVGQHHYEELPGIYSFQNREHEKPEYRGLMTAQIQAAESKMFDVVAHPDRAFRREKVWTEDMKMYSEKLISSCIDNNMCLEINLESQKKRHQFWPEFWDCVPENIKVVTGYDAHKTEDVRTMNKRNFLA